jgi:hypothetical protein
VPTKSDTSKFEDAVALLTKLPNLLRMSDEDDDEVVVVVVDVADDATELAPLTKSFKL